MTPAAYDPKSWRLKTFFDVVPRLFRQAHERAACARRYRRLHFGNNPVTDDVAGEGRFKVGWILPPLEPHRVGVLDQLLLPEREQWAPEPRLTERSHAGEPHRAETTPS